MATVKLLNSAGKYGDNVNGYSTQDDTFTASALSVTLTYSGGLGVRNGIYIGTDHVLYHEAHGLNAYSYTLNCDYNEVYFQGIDGFSDEDLYVYTYPTITYSVPSGTAPASQRVKTGEYIVAGNLPSITVSGYTFGGWYYDSNFQHKVYVGDKISQTANITMYARLVSITDMKNSVRNITIPEGVVKQIKVGNTILWTRPTTSGWFTVWSGNKTVSVTGNNGTISGTQSNFLSLDNGTGNTPKIRITFSITSDVGVTNLGTYGTYYYNNDIAQSGKPSSPFTINTLVSGSDKKIIGVWVENTSGSYGCKVWLEKDYDSTNDRCRFSLSAEKYSNGTNQATCSLKITKIEYYKPESAYRRLEYIESTGTQALDTGVNCARNSYMKLIVEDTDTAQSSQQQGRGAVQNNQRFAAGYSEGKYFFGLGNGWITGDTATSGKHTLGVQGPECQVLGNGQGYSIDGSFTSNSNTYPSGVTWYSVYLFGSRGNTSGSIQGPVKCKLYYAELGYTYNNNNQGYNRKYYPCQRKSDGKLGLYDTVNGTFLYELVSGSSSNTLTAGPIVDEDWNLVAPD